LESEADFFKDLKEDKTVFNSFEEEDLVTASGVGTCSASIPSSLIVAEVKEMGCETDVSEIEELLLKSTPVEIIDGMLS
jgi:hypothetical protein